jgi:hypothetical protein
VASSIAGTTLFFVVAMPTLVPELGLHPTQPESLAALREQLLGLVRRGLGSADSPSAMRSPSKRAGKRSPRR